MVGPNIGATPKFFLTGDSLPPPPWGHTLNIPTRWVNTLRARGHTLRIPEQMGFRKLRKAVATSPNLSGQTDRIGARFVRPDGQNHSLPINGHTW